jgi:hypothetical protein
MRRGKAGRLVVRVLTLMSHVAHVPGRFRGRVLTGMHGARTATSRNRELNDEETEAQQECRDPAGALICHEGLINSAARQFPGLMTHQYGRRRAGKVPAARYFNRSAPTRRQYGRPARSRFHAPLALLPRFLQKLPLRPSPLAGSAARTIRRETYADPS